jgi:hypothetical protein
MLTVRRKAERQRVVHAELETLNDGLTFSGDLILEDIDRPEVMKVFGHFELA